MQIRENVKIAPFTSFRIGGTARYFCEVYSEKELEESILYAREKGVPFFILGGGSNILFSDDGYDGLVIKINLRGMFFEKTSDGIVRSSVSAGEKWDEFVSESVRRNLFGIENLSAIPGTVGASPIQNIGAYGQEVKETIEWVDVFDTNKMKNVRLFANECMFGYRDSIFKKEGAYNYIVLSVAFSLKQTGKLNHSYDGVREYFEKKKIISPTLSDTREAIISIRGAKLPDITTIGTAGSFFKNPIVSRDKVFLLNKKFPKIPLRQHKKGFKISAAWLIENISEMKDARYEDAGVYKSQPLVLVDYKSARAKDIIFLAQKIEEKIFKKTGIQLEREVLVLGNK